MTIELKYSYSSVFASYILGLIQQKKTDGFLYDYESYILKTFDDFCIKNKYDEKWITRDIAMEWAKQRETEGINFRNQRVSFLRQLSLYMNSMGIPSYIPQQTPSEKISISHIFTEEELAAFFNVVDTYLSDSTEWKCFTMGYQLLFRLYYCCGLRLGEGCYLKKTDVNLEKGVLTIRQSKGRKDRLVYMSEDVVALCKIYRTKLEKLQPSTEWVFPGRKAGQSIRKTSIDKKFKQLWSMTSYAETCEKQPTVHSFRHTFVVQRMNQWMKQGIPLQSMMPYLCRYLGHSQIDDTMYYYHQVQEAFQIVRDKDEPFKSVILEVIRYEE